MSQENVEVVRRMIEAFNRDDVDGVIAAFAENCQIEEPLEVPDRPAVGYRGHAGIRDWMGNLRGVAQAAFHVRRFTASDDALLCELASSGIGQGSGVPIEWTTFAVITVSDGKIVRIRVFLNREEALEAVGLSE